MEEGKDGTLDLSARLSLHSGGGEGTPNNALANVGGNKERNARAETVALLKELVPQENEDTGEDELNDEEEARGNANLTVHSTVDVDGTLANSDDHADD